MKQIKYIFFDFDGVMTDNRVLVTENGKEAVFCNRADGIGVEMLRKAGYKMMIISTETNKIVRARAKKLKIPVINGVIDKKSTLTKLCEKAKISLNKVCYVGNDINDLDAMRLVGLKIAPHDAHPCILEIADIVTKATGGEGVIRELADIISNSVKNARKT